MQVPTWLLSCQQNVQLSSSYLSTSVLKIVTLLAVKYVQPSDKQRKAKKKHTGEQEADYEVGQEEEEGRKAGGRGRKAIEVKMQLR